MESRVLPSFRVHSTGRSGDASPTYVPLSTPTPPFREGKVRVTGLPSRPPVSTFVKVWFGQRASGEEQRHRRRRLERLERWTQDFGRRDQCWFLQRVSVRTFRFPPTGHFFYIWDLHQESHLRCPLEGYTGAPSGSENTSIDSTHWSTDQLSTRLHWITTRDTTDECRWRIVVPSLTLQNEP